MKRNLSRAALIHKYILCRLRTSRAPLITQVVAHYRFRNKKAPRYDVLPTDSYFHLHQYLVIGWELEWTSL
jgi:hypothetical protein